MGEKRGMQALEAWCRQVTAGYSGVNVTNMTSSWRDGLAFCALIHHFRPDLIDFGSLNAENVYHNNNLAFTVAEQQLGIPALLDPEDMVKFIPDRLSIMTYLSQFYQALAATKSKGDNKKTSDGDSESLLESSVNSSFENANQKRTPDKLQKEFARQFPVERRSPRTSELCCACQNPVFLAERLMVNNRLHHRVCFRCARCNSQLSLANYYETETGQYCCETCPDEVKNTPAELGEPQQQDDKVVVVECTDELRIEPPELRNVTSSASSVEKRLFLESLVDDTSDTTSLKFIDDAPPDVQTALKLSNEDCDDRGKLNSSTDRKTEEDLETRVEIAREIDVVQTVVSTPDVENEMSTRHEIHEEKVTVIENVEPVVGTPFDEEDDENEKHSSEEVPTAVELQVEEQSTDVSPLKEERNIEEPSTDVLSIKDERTVELSIQEQSTTDSSIVEEMESKVETPIGEENTVDTSVELVDKSVNDDEYPDDLNPFDEDSEDDVSSDARLTTTPRKVIPAPKISLNPFESDDEEDDEIIENPPVRIPPERPPPPAATRTPSIVKPSPSPKKRPAPAPPLLSLSPAIHSRSPTLSERSSARRKKCAPAPPGDEKAQKEMANLQTQALNKDSHGQWKRKKGPAPPRPLPKKRHLRKLPVQSIQQELNDIEVKQLELERQGVALEQSIRAVTEAADDCEIHSGGAHVEEMILQLFDLVNEKNELLRRQSEMMYIRRQQRLEEEHVELEFQIRCLMEKPATEKTDEDRLKEEELIERLVQVVHRRAEIVDCLELDRRRQAEEDESIQKHLDDYNTRLMNEPLAEASGVTESSAERQPKQKLKGFKAIQAPIKLLNKEKFTKRNKKKKDTPLAAEEDTENQNSNKPSSSDQQTSSEHHAIKDNKDKKKTKSWFAK